jgi:branched-chain amino acid aminotransferase
MSTYQLFNGKFYEANEVIIPSSNRAFCYGDGFFESMRISNGNAPFVFPHWQRLQRVCAFLQILIPEKLTLQTFNRYALELVAKNGWQNARVRFQGFRQGAGRYAPDKSELGWVMVCQPLGESQYTLNQKGLRLEVCSSHQINPAPQSSFKTSNSLPYVLGGMYAQNNGLDDCFLIDSNGFIAEATGSNVFLVKDNELVTPDLSNGGVGGVMRSVVIQESKSCGLSAATVLLSKEDILQADECFLTNASQGVQWVGAVGKKRYFKKVAEKLTHHINQKFGLLS